MKNLAAVPRPPVGRPISTQDLGSVVALGVGIDVDGWSGVGVGVGCSCRVGSVGCSGAVVGVFGCTCWRGAKGEWDDSEWRVSDWAVFFGVRMNVYGAVGTDSGMRACTGMFLLRVDVRCCSEILRGDPPQPRNFLRGHC